VKIKPSFLLCICIGNIIRSQFQKFAPIIWKGFELRRTIKIVASFIVPFLLACYGSRNKDLCFVNQLSNVIALAYFFTASVNLDFSNLNF